MAADSYTKNYLAQRKKRMGGLSFGQESAKEKTPSSTSRSTAPAQTTAQHGTAGGDDYTRGYLEQKQKWANGAVVPPVRSVEYLPSVRRYRGQSSASTSGGDRSFQKEPLPSASGTQDTAMDRLRKLEAQKSDLEAGLDLDGAAALDGEISALKKQLGLTLPQQFAKTVSGMAKAVPAGLEGTVGSMANAWTALYQAGQSGRDAQNREYLEEYSAGLTRAKRDMEVMLEENRDKPGSWSDRDIQSQQYIIDDWQRKYDAMAKVVGEDIQQKATQASYDLADDISGDSARRIEEAKEGLLLPGQIFVDATASTIQTLGDAALNTMMGTPGSMSGFGMRSFGGGMQQARQDMEAMGTDGEEGAFEKQLAYGLASMTKEIATEKMFGLSMPFGAAYGKGSLDDLAQRAAERAVRRFATTPAGKKALERGLGFAGSVASEGLEEFVGDWMEWQLPRIYGGDPDTLEETLENSIYDFLVGSASGGLGDAGGAAVNRVLNRLAGNTGSPAGDVELQELSGEHQSENVIQAADDTDTTIPTDDLLAQATEQTAEHGTVTNRMAELVLSDQAAMETLETEIGLSITEDMTKSQQRAAVKEAVSRLARAQDTISEGVRETAPARDTGAQAQQRSAAEQAHNILNVKQAAQHLGTQGAKTAQEFYQDSNISPAQYYGSFAAYYQAGVTGLEMDKVQTLYASDTLNDAQKRAAYLAGQVDAANSLKAEQSRVPFATVYGEDAGLVENDYAKTLPREDAAFLNDLSRSLGTKLMVEAELEHGAEGLTLRNGIIKLSAQAKNPLLVVSGHEITHRLQELAPEEYRAYRDYANARIAELNGRDAVEEIRERYANSDVVLSTEEAMDEVAAEFAEAMVKDGKLFQGMAKEHRTVAQRVLDVLREFVKKVKRAFKGNTKAQNSAAMEQYGVDMATLEEAARLWNTALKAAQDQAQTMTADENTAQVEDGEARYSINEQFSRDIQEWQEDGRPEGERFILGSTGPVLQGLGAIESDIYMNGDKINAILEQHPEMTIREIQHIPELLEDPVLVLKSKNTAKSQYGNSRLVMFGSVKAQDGRPVMCVLDLRPTERGFLLDDMQKVTSSYTKDINPVNFIQRSEILHADKKRTVPLLRDVGFTRPASLLRNGSMGSISYSGKSVNLTGEKFSDVVKLGEEEQTRFSLKAPVEETENLLALHNLTEDKLMKALSIGGFPMPSIAITKSNIPHTNFGDISLIFGKETIDPTFDRRNTVYSADAWTPTFPQTEYEIDEKVASRLRNKFYDLSRKYGREAVDALYPWGNYADDKLNREGGEAAVLAKLQDSTDMMKVYLLDSGAQVPDTITTETVTRLDDDKIRQYDYLLEKLGEDMVGELRTIGDETPMAARRRWLDAHGEALEDAYQDYLRDIGGVSEAEIKNLMESPAFSAKSLIRVLAEARRYKANGPETRTTTVDTAATQRAIREATDQEAYRAWLKELFGGIEKNSGIYNGKERYTNSGNLRSFKATHFPVTLENIAKAMAAEGDKDSRNVSGFYGVKSLRAGMAARFTSIEDMHRLEGRLKHLTEEEAGQITDALGDRLTSTMEKVYATKPHSEYDNQFMAFDSIGNILMDACRAKKITIDSIIKEFSGTGYAISNTLAAEIRDLLFDIGEMPVNIFEAKPERAVRFDEVLAAVLPDSASAELRKGLEDAGVRMLDYQAGDDADRLAKVNSVEGARFSLKGSSNIQREMAALQEENRMLRERVDYWRGQTKRTERVTTDKNAVKRAAQELIRSYGANINLEDIQGDLQALYDYIASGSEGENELTYTEARRRAEAIAQSLVENAVAVDDDGYRQYSDLRDYLRSANIVYGTEYHGDIADFGYFRRGLFGRLDLKTKGHTNIDQVYKELSERWPEFFDEQRESHPTDQLLRIAEVLEGIYDVTEYNPFSRHMEEAVAGAANEIMEGFFDLPQTRATFADRQARKLDDAKAKGRQQVQRLREQNNTRREELRQQNRQRVQKVIERERTVRERQLQRLRDHYAEVRKNQTERRADSQARSRLLKIARRLQNKKLPAVNRALLDQYIGDLDTTAKSMTGKTLERLTDLREWYDDRKQNDPDFISDPAIEADLARLSKRHISDLTAEEVADLTRILLNIENELRTERQLIDSEDRRDVYLQGVQVINDVENSGGSRDGIRGAFDNYIVTETLSPVRQIKRMAGYVKSDPMIQLVNALADGQRESLAYQMEAEKPFQKWAENKRFRKDFSGSDAKSISISGLSSGKGVVTVEITPAMRAALYLHSLNDQNLRHIRDGGITVPDMKLYRKGKLAEAYARGTTIKLTPSQVRSITAGMTAEERAFARAVHNYFNGQSRERINAVSEKLKGYQIAQVEDYFPINTDSSFTRSDFETLKFDGTLEGMGFLKERQAKAANPILLRDANLVLEQSIAQHGKYVGLAIPVRNFNKVWGVTKSSFNDDGSRNSYESSVQKAVKNTWGETGYNYVEKLMTDLQSGKDAKNIWIRLLNKVRSNYAGAVLTLNMSVAMKQAASYPTAAAVLGWGPLARAMGDVGKVDLDLIAKYTPLQWYRSKGFSTKELGDLRQTGGPIAKTMNNMPTVLNWVQGVDLITTRKLWKASEYYVRANNKGLSVGTEAYYKAVADVYNRVIEETQPNYTTMQRPQLLRSDDSLLGNLAMFKTQPFQNFNILYDAIGEYRAARKNGTDIRSAKANLNRAVTSQLAQLAVFAGMTMAWAMFRGRPEKYEDEEGEMTVLSVLKALGKDMAGGQFSSVPFGSDAWELLSSKLFGDKYYGMDAVTITALADTVNSLNGMGELLGGTLGSVSRGDDVNWGSVRIKMDGYLDDISKVAGVPYENVANLFNASYRHVCIATLGKYQGEYASLKLTADPEKKSSAYYDLLYQAMVSSRSEYQAIYQDMIDSGSFEADKIRSAMESRMKNAQGVENVADLEQRFLSPTQERTYSGIRQNVAGTNVWSAATAEQRSAAEDDIYNITVGNSSGEKLQEKIDGGAAYGIDEADYILYRLALHIVDQPSESGKLGSYTGEEVEAAIEMLPGLSDAARGYLWEAQGKSEKSNPYK